jgi:hypothetical protein
VVAVPTLETSQTRPTPESISKWLADMKPDDLRFAGMDQLHLAIKSCNFTQSNGSNTTPHLSTLASLLIYDAVAWSGIIKDYSVGQRYVLWNEMYTRKFLCLSLTILFHTHTRWKLLVGVPQALCSIFAILHALPPNDLTVCLDKYLVSYDRVCGHLIDSGCGNPRPNLWPGSFRNAEICLNPFAPRSPTSNKEDTDFYARLDVHANLPVILDGLPVSLYNLAVDPYEFHNVANCHQDVVRDLLDDLKRKYLPGMVRPVVPPFGKPMDPQGYSNAYATNGCVSPWL